MQMESADRSVRVRIGAVRVVRTLAGALVLAGAACIPAHAAAPEPLAVITILEGPAYLLRGVARWTAAEGVRLLPGDVFEQQDGGFARLEFLDGPVLDLGGGARVLLSASPTGTKTERGGPYLLTGWLKLIEPRALQDRRTAANATDAPAADARPLALTTPTLALAGQQGIAVVRIDGADAALFVEAGAVRATDRRRGGSARDLTAGQFSVLSANRPPTLAARPDPEFIAALPRPFRDAIPARLAQFRDRAVAPKPAGTFTYADVLAWLRAEPAIRRTLVGAWRTKANDPKFRSELLAHLADYPEWEPVLFPDPVPEKPKPG
jgi:hypothetical protein